MELTYRLTREDHQHFYRLAAARVAQALGWRGNSVLFASASGLLTMFALACLLFTNVISKGAFLAASAGYLWGVVSMQLCGAFWQSQYWQNWLPSDSPSLDQAHLKFSDDGIEASNRTMSTKYAWQAFSEISQSDGLLILWFDRGQAILVPGRVFANDEIRQQFIHFVQGHVGQAAM